MAAILPTENMKNTHIRNINWELPSSIIEIIFSKLPFYNVPSCRIVCKEWNDLILASKFDPRISNISSLFLRFSEKILCVDCNTNSWKGINTIPSFNFHPKLYSVDRYFSIANSCNGLLCLFIRKISSRNAYILNPMTNEYLKVLIDKGIDYRYGLGFSPKAKQYKVARASMELCGTCIQISPFGRNGTNRPWKTVCYLPSLYISDFVYSNGGLYFLISCRLDGQDSNDRVIYRLDVDDEKLSEISYPKDSKDYSMVDFNGILYLTTYTYVWKMREDFSWIKVFVPDSRGRMFNLIKVFEDEKILCMDGFDFVLYDPKSETKLILTYQNIELYSKLCDFIYLTPYRCIVEISSFNFKYLPTILGGSG